MTHRAVGFSAALFLVFVAIVPHGVAEEKASPATNDEKVTTLHAAGPFEVKLAPQGPDEITEGTGLGRMSIDKTFHRDLEATSKGQMLAFTTGTEGSAGYVALEHVTGKLQGREGTFVLQHIGTMNRGQPSLSVTVVPDSATGDLEGLTGTMDIIIEDGEDSYEFEYSPPESV